MESKDLLEKLEKVERTVNIYDKVTETEIEELSVNASVEKLKPIVPPKDDDPFLYLGYVLDSNQLDSINTFLETKIIPDFERYFYVLECHGVYNW